MGTKIARDASYSTRAPAWASSEYDGCRPAVATSRSQSTGCPSRRTPATRPLRPCASMCASGDVRRSTTRGTATPASRRSSAISSSRSSAASTTARSPGLIEKSLTRRRMPLGSITPTRSFPGNTSGCSSAPVGDDDPLGAEAVEDGRRSRPGRGFPPRSRVRCRREHLDALELDARVPRVLVDEHDPRARRRGGQRGRAPRAPAADDEHARPPVLDVVAPRVPRVLADLPEPGEVPQHLLVLRPQEPRADHRPVVEADRRERPTDLVRDREQVAVQRAPDVLRLDDRAVADRLDADAHVRYAVDGHQAVRAVSRAAEEAARPVVLERAREDPLPAGVQRGAEGVAGMPAVRQPVEGEDRRARSGR